jgi:5-methylcytosine-specific restriction enzyme A
MARNPDWVVDELILVLDLYLEYGQLDDTDPTVIEASEILNRLPIHSSRPDLERFRNPNGVALKMANFRAIDPSELKGRGASRVSQVQAALGEGDRRQARRR